MNKMIMLTLALGLGISTAANAQLFPISPSVKEGKTMEAGTICIGGYLHSYLVVNGGVSLVQLMKDGSYNDYPNNPIKCK